MSNTKYDIPLIIVDTRNKQLQTIPKQKIQLQEKQQTPSKIGDSLVELFPLLIMVVKKMWLIVQEPLAAKSLELWDWIKTNLTVYGKQLPWLKISIIGLLVFITFKKDLQLTLGTAPTNTIFSDERNAKETNAKGVALAIKNPYAPTAADDIQTKKAKKFIRKHKDLAQEEMARTGIPASVKMAQALIESNAGTSKLALGNNNFFGIKCFSKNCKKGHCSNATDDHHKDFFRIYKSDEASWQAHSQLLSGKRYKHLKQHGKNYYQWAVGLKKAGYATDKNYHKKIINTIEKFQLYRLDQ